MELILKWTDIVFLPHWTAWSWIVTVINLWSRTSSCWWWMQQVIQNYSKEPSWVGHFWFNKFLKFRSLEPKENLNDQIMNYKLCSCMMQTWHVFQIFQLFKKFSCRKYDSSHWKCLIYRRNQSFSRSMWMIFIEKPNHGKEFAE